MPATNPAVDVVVLVNRSTGKASIRYESGICSSNESYDPTLRARRNGNNMVSPVNPQRRLLLLGQVWGLSSATPPPGQTKISRDALRFR
jgi:hypothetical protein